MFERKKERGQLNSKFKKEKNSCCCCPSVGAKRFLPHFSEVSTESIRAVTRTL